MQVFKIAISLRRVLRLFCAAALLPAFVQAAPVSKTVTPEESCAALERNNALVTHSSLQPAFKGTGQACVVHGEIISSAASTIHFRVDLPRPESWNTKLLMIPGGGFDGVVTTDSPDWAQFWAGNLLGADADRVFGYVVVSSDSGHQGRGPDGRMDFSWVSHNPTALRNHAYEANHATLTAAVDLVQQFYGKSPGKRYIMGGSNGGRAGLVAIQHYPTDYDGVLAFLPAISQEGFAANLGPQLLQHVFSSPENWLNAAQIALFEKGELAACDALDGLKDGILSNAAACRYDARDLLCPAGQKPSDACLTEGQIESVRRIFSDKNVPVTLADGWVGYAGVGRGAESNNWPIFLFGPSFAARGAADFVLVDQIVKWGITNDPNATLMTHDPTQWAQQYRSLSDEIDATNPDLGPFYEHGGKLIVLHAVADACVSYRQTARYIESVQTRLGAAKAREFMRFYTSPAVGHFTLGPGASTEPLLSVLEAWVEKGRAPESVTATLRQDSAQPGSTRPLCEYPRYPRYKGKGDPASAASFECAE